MKTSLVFIVMLIAIASMKCPPDTTTKPVIGAPNPCTPPDGEMIAIIPPNAKDTRCHDILTLLSADDGSVDNVCDFETVDGELVYNFHFYYRTPFVFDGECL